MADVENNCTGWVPVLINPSTPHTNFVLDNNKLISLNPIFQGWLGKLRFLVSGVVNSRSSGGLTNLS